MKLWAAKGSIIIVLNIKKIINMAIGGSARASISLPFYFIKSQFNK